MAILAFQKPDKVIMNEADEFHGIFEFRPLEPGFGITIGNALRRILLSSLEGFAITSVKIDGVVHEFSTVKGVVEDVTEIVLNLKKIRFKQQIQSETTEKVNIIIGDQEVFTAGDINKFLSVFQVLNPEEVICNLDPSVKLSMELTISKGRGYVPAEENKLPDQPIGTIPIDAVFSPMKRVSFKVEETRVGQRIDYERLIMEIYTDGSITPDDALTYAGKIIKDHIQLFINFDIEPEQEESPEIDEEAHRIRKLLKLSVDELELSVRSHNCLMAANIKTIGDLVGREEQEMLKFRNFGRKSLTELTKILEEKGLYFGMDIDKYLKPENY